MSSALEKLRSRARVADESREPHEARETRVDGLSNGAARDVRARRGVVTTVSAQIDGLAPADESSDDDQDDDGGGIAKPGRLPASPSAPTRRGRGPVSFPALTTPAVLESDAGAGERGDARIGEGVLRGASMGASRGASTQSSSIDRLRERARVEQEVEIATNGFKKDMAALRTLSRLMEAVYVRPGNAAPTSQRMQALLSLTQASREMAQTLLESIGETPDRAYTRAMAMDAVVGLVGQCWKDAEDEDEFLRNKPLDLLRQAAVHPDVVLAAQELSQKTWNPVASLPRHEEAMIMAAHKAYWSLYMLGEHVAGMDTARCEFAVSRLMSYLQEYPHPRGGSPDMRANWLSASMGRLSGLVKAEVKARFAVRERDMMDAKPVTNEALSECVDLAIEGFENVERHAQKLLGDAFVARPLERPAVHDGAADPERAVAGR